MTRSRGDMASLRHALLLFTTFNFFAFSRAGPLGPLPNVTSADLGLKEGSCALGDVVYMPGDEFPGSTPCEKCRCADGGVQCEKQVCEPRPGCKALHRPDHCCPTYQCECEQEGRVYGNGEKLVDPADPCRVCYCQGGEVVCRRIACFVRDDCTPRLVSGRCCPEYDNCPLRGVTSLPGLSTPVPSVSTAENAETPIQPPNPKITIKEITPVSEIPVITEVKIKEILPSPSIEVAEYSSSKSPLIPREATSEKNVKESDSKTESPSVVEVHFSSPESTQFTVSENKDVDAKPSKISFSTQDSINSSIYPSNVPIVASMGVPPVTSEPLPVATTKAPIIEEEDTFDHNPAFPPLPDDLALVLRNHEDEIVPEVVVDNEHVPSHDIVVASAAPSTEAEVKEPVTTTKDLPDTTTTTTTETPKVTEATTQQELSTEAPIFKESPTVNLRSAIPTEILSSASVVPEVANGQYDEKTTVADATTLTAVTTSESSKRPQETENTETTTNVKTTTEIRTTPSELSTTSAEPRTTSAETRTPSTGSKTTSVEQSTTSTGTKISSAETRTTFGEQSTTFSGTRSSSGETRTTSAEVSTTPAEAKITPAEVKTTVTETGTTPVEVKTTSAETRTTSNEGKTSESITPTPETASTTIKSTEFVSEAVTKEQEQTTTSISKSNVATEVTSQTELSSLPVETSDQNPSEVSEQIIGGDRAAPSTSDPFSSEIITVSRSVSNENNGFDNIETTEFVLTPFGSSETATDGVELIKISANPEKSAAIIDADAGKKNNVLTDLINLVSDVASISDHTNEPEPLQHATTVNSATLSDSEELLPMNAGYKSKNKNFNQNSITEVPFKSKIPNTLNKQKVVEIEDDESESVTDSLPPNDKVEPTTRRPIIDNVSDDNISNNKTAKKDIEIITQSYVPTINRRPTKVIMKKSNEKPALEEAFTVSASAETTTEGNASNDSPLTTSAETSASAETSPAVEPSVSIEPIQFSIEAELGTTAESEPSATTERPTAAQ